MRREFTLQWRKLYRTFLRSSPRSYNFLTLDGPLEHREREFHGSNVEYKEPFSRREYTGAESLRGPGWARSPPLGFLLELKSCFRRQFRGRWRRTKNCRRKRQSVSLLGFSSRLEYNPDFPAPPPKETFTASRHETHCRARLSIQLLPPAIVRREFINLDVDARVHSSATEMNDFVSPARSRAICQITLVCSKHFPELTEPDKFGEERTPGGRRVLRSRH